MQNKIRFVFLSTHRIAIICLIFSVLLLGCSKTSESLDAWEMAKGAYKLKKVSEVRDNLITLGSVGFAGRYMAECKSDERKCIDALDVLHSGMLLTGDKGSLPDKVACSLMLSFSRIYLTEVETELILKESEVPASDDLHQINIGLERVRADLRAIQNTCT